MEHEDFKLPSYEEFKKLSEDEKRETIRNLIHTIKEDGSMRAVLFNPDENETYSMNELLESLGEEKVINILINVIEKGHFSQETFSKSEINDAIDRKRKGTATEKDEQMLTMLHASIEDSESMMLNKNLIGIFIELIDFLQNERFYNPTMGDFLAAYNLFMSVTGLFSEDSSLSKYKQAGPFVAHQIISKMGKDILDTWLSTCTEIPDDYILLSALLEAAQGIANKIRFCDSKVYKDVLHNIIPEGMNEECECDCCEEECHCHSDNTNGSNEHLEAVQPKTYKSKDQDMRNMLKE